MSTIERLRRRPDFLAAAEGRRFHTDRMTGQGRLREPAAAGPDASCANLRIGFTITKRVGHATERNRIRRRLRAAVAAVAADLPAVPADIVLIARRPALQASFEALKDDLRRAVPAVLRPRGAEARPRRSAKADAGRADASKAVTSRADPPAASSANPEDSSRRDAEPSAAPRSLPNTCGGVPDGQ